MNIKEFLRVHKIIIICSGQRKKIQKIISQQQDYSKTDMIKNDLDMKPGLQRNILVT